MIRKNKNKLRVVRNEEEPVVQRKVFELVAKSAKQQEYLNALSNHKQVIVLGPSGTGKSYCAASHAASLYASRSINKIVITRPAVAVGRSLGALPGTLDDKFGPWMSPILSIFVERLGRASVDMALKSGNIIMAPLEYMRGSTFKDSFVIVEEGQNLTIPEFKMLVTRVGENCNLVLNGDVRQSDIKEQSGLAKAIQLAKKFNMGIPVIEFTIDDIVRSDICKQWIVAFTEENI